MTIPASAKSTGRNAASVAQRIRAFNQGRDPERLARKYRNMRQSAFAFYRATNHLFAAGWPADAQLDAAPLAWCCGDLHLENFGAYRGDNRLEYYDVNDFDEALLAPCTWDLARFVTSVLVAAHDLGLRQPQALALCRRFLETYVSALADGKARWVERECATGLVKSLLSRVRARRRKDLLTARTMVRGGRRRLRCDGEHALPVPMAGRHTATRALRQLAPGVPGFFTVLDVARRIAGTGSLGVERYVILVQGKGPGKNCLIDLKAAQPSVLAARRPAPRMTWRREAERVVAVQRRAQAVAPALLHAVEIGSTSFVLRELQPNEDRVSLERCRGKLGRLDRLIVTMAQVTAWMHLRSSGRQGAAVADAFGDLAGAARWRTHLLDLSVAYSRQVRLDWREFCRAMDTGEL